MRSQEDVKWDKAKQETEPCCSCGHYYTMTLESRAEVEEANNVLKADHSQLMMEYNNLSVAQKREEAHKGKA